MTRDDFESWKGWEVTQQIFKYLERRKQNALEKTVDIACGNSIDLITLFSARTAGFIMGVNEVTELEYEDLTEDIRKGETV